MTNKIKQLGKLGSIAQVTLDEELGKLASIKQEVQVVDDELKALASQAETRSANLEASIQDDIALFVGADAQWARWIKKERLHLLQKKAGIAIRQEMQFEQTRLALGKVEALKALSRREAAKLK